MFYEGQKVICIDDRPGTRTNQAPPFKINDILIITEIYFDKFAKCNAICVNGDWKSWKEGRFRPIIKKKTDISIFTAILTSDLEKV